MLIVFIICRFNIPITLSKKNYDTQNHGLLFAFVGRIFYRRITRLPPQIKIAINQINSTSIQNSSIMKRIIIYAALLSCVLPGCKHSPRLSQAGVYKLVKQTVSGGGKDSTYARTQIKIYTDHNFMYAGMTPDSSIGFGAGSYSVDTGNRIIEHRIYTSSTLDTPRTFHLKITPTDSGYLQTIPAMAAIKGVQYDLNEQYTRLPLGDSSVLDGLWKLDKIFSVKGKDTTVEQATQFKIFWKGSVMFITRYPADKAATKFNYCYGSGSFSFKGNQLEEDIQMSNDAKDLNQKWPFSVTMKGNDEFV